MLSRTPWQHSLLSTTTRASVSGISMCYASDTGTAPVPPCSFAVSSRVARWIIVTQSWIPQHQAGYLYLIEGIPLRESASRKHTMRLMPRQQRSVAAGPSIN